jgi:hypothetical protein
MFQVDMEYIDLFLLPLIYWSNTLADMAGKDLHWTHSKQAGIFLFHI